MTTFHALGRHNCSWTPKHTKPLLTRWTPDFACYAFNNTGFLSVSVNERKPRFRGIEYTRTNTYNKESRLRLWNMAIQSHRMGHGQHLHLKWIWKVLSIKKLFQGKNYLRGKIMSNTWVMYEYMNRDKEINRQFLITIPNLHTNCNLNFKNVNLTGDRHTGGKSSIHDPKHHKRNRLLSLENSCWLSLV